MSISEAKPSKRQAEILKLLSDGKWWRENNIGSSCHFLRQMYFIGWLDGAGYDDDRGTGNYPHTRVWKITKQGSAALRRKSGDDAMQIASNS